MASKSRKSVTIQAASIPKSERIHFSFEFYDTERDAYCLSKWTQGQIRAALGRLKQINAMTYRDLAITQGRVFHAHEVEWEQTREPNGFQNTGLQHLEPFQFALLSVNSGKARVYGAFDGQIFYIVWFDLDHYITPSKLKHT